MRLAIIRQDLPAPVRLTDLEQVSRRNVAVDAEGQEGYLRVPTVAALAAALANSKTGVGATLVGSGAPTSLVIAAGNKVLKLKTSSAAGFGTYTLAEATYASVDTLVVALNAALKGSGIRAFKAGAAVALESEQHGEASYLQLDTVANGSTANTNLNFANGATRTVPTAATFYTAAGLPNGPLTLGQATLEAVGSGTSARALEPLYDAGDSRAQAVANAVAPIYAETDVALESFLVGNIAQYRSTNYNPDPRRKSVPKGAAIAVLEDDGATAFTTANTLPIVTTADLDTPSSGVLTISGTGLGNENGGGTDGNGIVVNVTGRGARRLEQKAIVKAGGSVLPSAIVIPASLIPGVATSTSFVQIQVRHRVSNRIVLS